MDAVEVVHRIVGYPLAFVVAPLALATFAGAPGHRLAGRAYGIGMTFLYLTGSWLTLTRHDWAGWEFGRNVTFNLLGYSLLLHGWRSMWLRNHPARRTRTVLDGALLASLAALTVAIAVLALLRANTPMRVFAVIAGLLLALELRDWRAAMTDRQLYQRHVRYMLGSYFYVLTVVSLVHLRQEMPSDLRWLWPSALALATIGAAGTDGRRRALAVRGLLVVAVAFGAYVLWEVARDHGQVERVLRVMPSAEEARRVVQVEALDLVPAVRHDPVPRERAVEGHAQALVARHEAAVNDLVGVCIDGRKQVRRAAIAGRVAEAELSGASPRQPSIRSNREADAEAHPAEEGQREIRGEMVARAAECVLHASQGTEGEHDVHVAVPAIESAHRQRDREPAGEQPGQAPEHRRELGQA